MANGLVAVGSKMANRIGEDSHSGILGTFLLYLVPNFYLKKPLPI